jgi:LysM repeat protein
VRVRVVFLVSLVLNVALAIALVTSLSSASKSKPRVVPLVSAASIKSNLLIVKTNVLVRPRAFTWQEVESPDYAIYVENLRALGMPEKTIHDIIVADVDQLFARRQREDALKQDVEWWRSTPSPEVQSNLVARARSLETERAALLAKLLGTDWDKGRVERETTPLPLTGPVLGALPEEVKQAVRNIAGQSQERVRQYLTQVEAANGQSNEGELARIREETRQQLAAVLNPLQLEEYLLRYSENANRLRTEMTGMNTTAEEFRALFRAVDAIDREIQLRYSGDDPSSRRVRQNLDQQRLAAIRNALGSERFQTYQTVQDPGYREALAVAQGAGEGEQAALALYEINRATVDEINRIRNDPSLTDAQKQQQLQETQMEQQRARSLVLGEQLPPEPEATTASTQPQFRPHAMQPFETLGQISLRYGVRLSALREANPGIDINRVPPGTVINIPPPNLPPLPYPPQPRRR